VHSFSYTVLQTGAAAAPYPEGAEEAPPNPEDDPRKPDDPDVIGRKPPDPPWLPWPSGLLLGLTPKPLSRLLILDCFAKGLQSRGTRAVTAQSSTKNFISLVVVIG